MRSILMNIALGVTLGAAGMTPALAQQDFSKVEIKTIKLSDTLYMLMGEGGNIGVSADLIIPSSLPPDPVSVNGNRPLTKVSPV